MIEISRQKRKLKPVSLVSLIDVIFLLLIYFMVTSSFVQSESLELALPQSNKAEQKVTTALKDKALHIYISDIGETFLEQKSMNEEEMMEELKKVFSNSPERGILVLSSSKVSVQVMVRVMDRIYTAGGKNIAVANWVIPNQNQPQEIKPAEAQPNG